MNEHQTKKILTILSPVWPASGLAPEVIPAFTMALASEDPALLELAAAEWIREERWMPKPVELITRARIIGAEREASARREAYASTASLEERIAQKKRILAKFAEMHITPHPSHRATLERLEAEREAAGGTPRETPPVVRAREPQRAAG